MTAKADEPEKTKAGAQRLDKWLWFARLAKTRTLAAGLVTDGKIWINREKVSKPSETVKPGDVITSSAHHQIRIVRVVAPGERRGPAPEAATLYEDLTPPPPPRDDSRAQLATGSREAGAGRPTKRDRRLIEKLKGRT